MPPRILDEVKTVSKQRGEAKTKDVPCTKRPSRGLAATSPSRSWVVITGCDGLNSSCSCLPFAASSRLWELSLPCLSLEPLVINKLDAPWVCHMTSCLRFSLMSRCRLSLSRWLAQIASRPFTVPPAGLILEGYVTTHTPTSRGRLSHWTCSSRDSTAFYRVRRTWTL